ncbi:deoxyguanosinetriphosphate triphosphohydrolase [Alkaliphilus hydrothermalis]|uniref:DGTPase n=1 Tax=Alkaliphilus hydrothermalis TaxID=1482730 RepID=A0ABS2NNX1_9FIRM|nr:deoxyguanosinetriphosphate triphosphohydrolase [Alkaliphilus hydrothermalis]MBM7614632.1 dGTPase [Alkaliphilus hydrothermalis]
MVKNLREVTEAFETEYLSEFAQPSRKSVGRREAEEECDIRTAYQRDRDRIIHCKSFRALKEKTQVFIVKDDFFRTRLSHTFEVSQISRTIARALKLNEDLVEAIALGHDLGHTCFGHGGEDVLNQITGHFRHNEQSLRIVDVLERDGRGLNLTEEVRDGILNHTGLGIPTTMEGKLVRIADRITYLCHDIQDSVSAGILKENDIPRKFLAVLGDAHSRRVNTFVKDMILETSLQIQKGNHFDIYQSDLIREVMHELRNFMFKNVYHAEVCSIEKEKASFIVTTLFEYFMENPHEMPKEYCARLEKEEKKRVVTDLIAGSTDAYAIRVFQTKFIPSPK